MNKLTHRFYIGIMSTIVIVVSIYLTYIGYSYYSSPIHERFYHPDHNWLKPSGVFGHGLGFIGTFLILFGVVLYIVAKKYMIFERFVRLKYILEFHIFLCTLGPILVLFHTSMKFGGIVSIGFWSMAMVFFSGIIGRYIYIQIPRNISGRELSLQEIQQDQQLAISKITTDEELKIRVNDLISQYDNPFGWGFKSFLYHRKQKTSMFGQIQQLSFTLQQKSLIRQMVKKEISMKLRIQRLDLMRKLFKYWHIIHRPFSIIMLVIVLIHIGISFTLGYRWIF
tara:strand:+ start:41905 stop:42747 length:843 start_codon:yes stop_codon:yes gene_type:complete